MLVASEIVNRSVETKLYPFEILRLVFLREEGKR